jgi:4-amino-4-deoxy-L-arabinose transferase-like glycosyltransferase
LGDIRIQEASMADIRRFTLVDLVLLAVVLAAAAGARAAYLGYCADGGRNSGPLRVEEPSPTLTGLPPDTTMRDRKEPTDLDALVHNLTEHHWFGSLAPFAATEEQTAHVAPGYPWLLSWLSRLTGPAGLDHTVRWIQCGLGALTAGLYFLFARRAFRHRGVAALAGLLGAVYPFWVIDTASMTNGVLASFLLALVLVLGVRAGQVGGPFVSFVYGLALAGASLVRAALLPFALVAVAWFLWRSRRLPSGWLCALVAFLGFAIGLAPWVVRNLQVFGEPIPIVDSVHLHFWIGNNPQANGGPATASMLASAPGDELAKVSRQPERYNRLGTLAWQEIRTHPAETLRRRLQAGLAFFFGERWLRDGTLAEEIKGEGEMPERLAASYPAILQGTLLALLLLAVLGWRWTYAWRWEARPSALAIGWVFLPYLLSHAGALSGPRLPLDGIFLCYAAVALVCLVPGLGVPLFAGGTAKPDTEPRPQ